MSASFCLRHKFDSQNVKPEFTVWHYIAPSQLVHQKIHCRELPVVQGYFGIPSRVLALEMEAGSQADPDQVEQLQN